MVNVAQTVFSIDDFNIDDVGALFRSAAGISGSSSQQLQIVDSSSGDVFMSVSTNPESRTVFFYPSTRRCWPAHSTSTPPAASTRAWPTSPPRVRRPWRSRFTVGAWLDYAGSTTSTVRRLRTATVPVTINERSQRPDLPLFSCAGERGCHLAGARSGPSARRVRRDHLAGITVDACNGVPRMYFTIGTESLVTDLDGREVRCKARWAASAGKNPAAGMTC